MKKLIITGSIILGTLGIGGYTVHAATTNTNQKNNTSTYCYLNHQNCNINHNNNHNNSNHNRNHYNNHNGNCNRNHNGYYK